MDLTQYKFGFLFDNSSDIPEKQNKPWLVIISLKNKLIPTFLKNKDVMHIKLETLQTISALTPNPVSIVKINQNCYTVYQKLNQR